jgi:hypothetical protein
LITIVSVADIENECQIGKQPNALISLPLPSYTNTLAYSFLNSSACSVDRIGQPKLPKFIPGQLDPQPRFIALTAIPSLEFSMDLMLRNHECKSRRRSFHFLHTVSRRFSFTRRSWIQLLPRILVWNNSRMRTFTKKHVLTNQPLEFHFL